MLDQLSIEPSISINHVALPHGEFTTRLFGARTDYAFSPRMFASALLQFSSVVSFITRPERTAVTGGNMSPAQ